jgi:hypothetical protein
MSHQGSVAAAGGIAGSPEAALPGGRDDVAPPAPIEALRAARARILEVDRSLAAATSEVERADLLLRQAREAAGDRGALETRILDLEQQVGGLMTLYVATYQLHATLDPNEVRSTIVDIVLNLLGAQVFLLLLRDEQIGGYEVAIAHGPGATEAPFIDAGRYAGGDELIDATLERGGIELGPAAGSSVMASIPLRVQDVTVGALVVLKLLPHKPMFQDGDRELFDLIAAHAASAFVASRVHSRMSRKLRTLEELLRLARGA